MSKIELYQHPRMTDVALKILWKDVVDDRRQMIGIEWWNVVPSHSPYPMGYRQAITVDNERTDMLISYTGNAPLGNEGDSLRLTITGECTRVIRPGEYRGGSLHPTGAFICTADEVSK